MWGRKIAQLAFLPLFFTPVLAGCLEVPFSVRLGTIPLDASLLLKEENFSSGHPAESRIYGALDLANRVEQNNSDCREHFLEPRRLTLLDFRVEIEEDSSNVGFSGGRTFYHETFSPNDMRDSSKIKEAITSKQAVPYFSTNLASDNALVSKALIHDNAKVLELLTKILVGKGALLFESEPIALPQKTVSNGTSYIVQPSGTIRITPVVRFEVNVLPQDIDCINDLNP
jgi:hypothetical protein